MKKAKALGWAGRGGGGSSELGARPRRTGERGAGGTAAAGVPEAGARAGRGAGAEGWGPGVGVWTGARKPRGTLGEIKVRGSCPFDAKGERNHSS